MLTNKQIIELATHYENTHPVEDYRFYDWNVWPLIREGITLAAMTPIFSPEGFKQKKYGRIKKLLWLLPFYHTANRLILRVRSIKNRWKRQKDRALILDLDTLHNDNHLVSGKDVVVLTLSGRRQKSDQGLYEIYSDPLVELLKKLGVSSVVWEQGVELWPRHSSSVWISRLIDIEFEEVINLPLLKEPLWFKDIKPFAIALLGRDKPWSEVECSIRHLQQLSIIFEKWLRVAEAKLIISVCWYDPLVMAATLAARRLGIVSADLQHGIQGAEHDAYSGWTKSSSAGHELVPDVFACWGNKQAKQAMEYNAAFSRNSSALAIGNLWLNKWIYSDCSIFDSDRKQIAGWTASSQKNILVSFQHGGEFNDFIIDAIKQSPDSWFWLLRFHPATPTNERSHIEKLLLSLPKKNYEFEVSSQIAMYALMQQSNVHITGNSTTAQEALCFGLPTITVTRNGASAYSEFIDAGTMLFAENVAELFKAIVKCENITSKQCQNSVQNYFASQKDAEDGMRQLLSVAGIVVPT